MRQRERYLHQPFEAVAHAFDQKKWPPRRYPEIH